MPENQRIRVYYEGNDDRNVLEGLQRAGLLRADCEIAKRDIQHGGKDGLVRELAPFVRPVNGVGGKAVTLVDLDDLSYQSLTEWFRKQLDEEVKGTDPPITLEETRSTTGRVVSITLTAGDHSGRVALIGVGLADDDLLKSTYQIDRFAMDDYLLRLVREPAVFAAVSELKDVTHELAVRKMSEIAELLRKNGIAIGQSKRFLHILRAVAAFRASSAEFIRVLMKKAAEALSTDALRAIFSAIVQDLDEATLLLDK